MKKIIPALFWAFSLVTLFSFTEARQPALQSSLAAARVSWSAESHDFGEIAKGIPVTVVFRFSNDGDDPVLISEVVPSCGCTIPDYSKEPIAPGKSSEIKVTYNAANSGAFNKSITVHFQDASLKKVLLIKGTVK